MFAKLTAAALLGVDAYAVDIEVDVAGGLPGMMIVGLPDTIWYPADALAALPDDRFSFLCFPVDAPEHFDAVTSDPDGRVREIQVKQPGASSRWVWGAFKMPGRVFHELRELWRARRDEYVGTLVNAYLAAGGKAVGLRTGRAYVDVGTLHGYRAGIQLLAEATAAPGELTSGARVGLGVPLGRVPGGQASSIIAGKS